MLENTSIREFLYYGSRRITIETKKRTQLKGNFVVPFSRENLVPAVLLIHGAAKGFNPLPYFQEIQSMLAGAGFLSLAVNLSGVGTGFDTSGGEYSEQSIATRVEDAITAWDYLKSEKNVDSEKMALITGSLGGHVGSKMNQ